MTTLQKAKIVVLASCKADESSYGNDDGGYYTRNIVYGLEHENSGSFKGYIRCDSNHDGKITAGELGNYSNRLAASLVKNGEYYVQTPQYYASNKNEILFSYIVPVVKLNLKSASLYVGEGSSLEATVSGKSASKVKWTSSNNAIVTVRNGKLTAKGSGTATITASSTIYGTIYSASCKVNVREYNKAVSHLILKSIKTGTATLYWNKVSGAAGYRIYRATSKNGNYTWVKSVSGTSYTDTGLIRGKTYYYKVLLYTKSDTNYIFGKYSPAVEIKRK